MESKKEKNLEITGFEEKSGNKKNLSVDQQKNLLLLLKLRKNFTRGSSLIKKIRKSIANFKTLKNTNKEEK